MNGSEDGLILWADGEHEGVEVGIVEAGVKVIELVGKFRKFSEEPDFLELFQTRDKGGKNVGTTCEDDLFILPNKRLRPYF